MASQMGFSLSLICLNRNNTVESERRHLEFTLETTYPEKKIAFLNQQWMVHRVKRRQLAFGALYFLFDHN